MTSPDILLCRDPASGELLGELPQCGIEHIERVVAAAREAQPAWANTAWETRAAVFGDILDSLVRGQLEVARLLAHDTGKTMSWGVLEEIIPAAERLEFLASAAAASGRSLVPHGVVALAMGHRTPLYDTLAIGATALAAGNSLVLKPDARSSWCTIDFAQRMRDALTGRGHSSALVEVITGNEETERLVRGADVDVIGSTQPERTSPRARTWLTVATEDPPEHDRMRALLAPLGGPRPCTFLVSPEHIDAWEHALRETLNEIGSEPPATEAAELGVAGKRDAEDAAAAIAAAVARGAERHTALSAPAEFLRIAEPLDPVTGQRIDAPLVILAPIRDPETLGAAVRGLPHPVAAVVLNSSEDEGRSLGRSLGVEDLFLSPWGAWARPVFGPPTSDHQVDLRRMGTSQAVTASPLRDVVASGVDLETLESLVRTRFSGGTLPRVQAAASLLRNWWSRR